MVAEGGSFMTVLYQKKGRIAYITLNRPEALNAINLETQRELARIWVDFRDDPDVWVAILTGAGERAFSAGVDLREKDKVSDVWGSWDTGEPALPNPILGAMEIWKPVIAAVQGYCLGMGCTLALSCDIRIAAENAVFGYPEVAQGIAVSVASLLLPRLVPSGIAMEILLTADNVDAREACRIGLVNKVVPLSELVSTAEKTAMGICDNAPLAVRATKETAIRGWDMPFDQGRRLGVLLARQVNLSEDAREGPRAFVEKRKPVYKGI